MKNVDVPMWDKGDSTDNYSKGVSLSQLPKKNNSIIRRKNERESKIKNIFQLVLGREASSRELAYYKYSSEEYDDIIKDLLESDEHKETIEKGTKYHTLEKEFHRAKSRVVKLNSVLNDKEKEIEQSKKLLDEKNNVIKNLREETKVPYITDISLIEESKGISSKAEPYYSNLGEEKKEKFTDVWDRILNIFFGGSKWIQKYLQKG